LHVLLLPAMLLQQRAHLLKLHLTYKVGHEDVLAEGCIPIHQLAPLLLEQLVHLQQQQHSSRMKWTGLIRVATICYTNYSGEGG
jgi:hypothetical protein